MSSLAMNFVVYAKIFLFQVNLDQVPAHHLKHHPTMSLVAVKEEEWRESTFNKW